MKSVENKNFKISVNRCIFASCTKIYEISKIGQSYICINAGSTLAASNIRNLDCSSYEVYLIDYGCGKFNKKVHIME